VDGAYTTGNEKKKKIIKNIFGLFKRSSDKLEYKVIKLINC
jgi:hypothetical protein